MTRKKTTKQNPPEQPIVSDIIPDRFTYNVEEIEDFIDMVFHAKQPDEGNILLWYATGQPRFPVSEEGFHKLITRKGSGAALYFGTSTTEIDPETGKLRNRKSLFRSFHVLVLDDIGTKVPFDKIPDTFEPTYKIESSEGNWQYGYVLEEPIMVEEQATALVQLAYDAGFSDAGGKMSTKLVRLPGGINGKKGNNQYFEVHLADMNGPFWTPEDILEEIDCGVMWKDVVANVDGVMKTRAAATVGTSVWSPIKAVMPSLSGVVDPALEWLYGCGMVKQEMNDWTTVLCPQADQHTNGDNTAGYSPMGWGVSPYRTSRVFHCFHDSCTGYHSQDFLQYIADNGGPELPVTERAADLVKRYAYTPLRDGVYDVMAPNPHFIAMKALANLHPEMTWVQKYGEKKPKLVAETRLFTISKARLTVLTQVYDPTTPARIVQTEYGNMLNTYTPPKWGDGDYDQEHIDRFEEFINYLVPNAKARKFFLDWLAAKCQSMAFRGPAVLMIATQQGTGRTTLGNMVTTMLGDANVVHKEFDDIIKAQGFNIWMTKGLVITNETLGVSDSRGFYKAAEKLKQRIDTTPTPISVELKGVDEYSQMCYSSYLMFSNHAGALRIAENDRRFYVIDNPEVPADPEFFTELNQWLEDGTWAKSVFRWLRQREVDMAALLRPPELTQAKEAMIDATKQPIDIAIEAILEAWPCNLVTQNQVSQILDQSNAILRLGMDEKFYKTIVKKVFRQNVVKLNIEDDETSRFAIRAVGHHDAVGGLNHWVPRCKLTPECKLRFVHTPAHRSDIEIERDAMPDNYDDIVNALYVELEKHDL